MWDEWKLPSKLFVQRFWQPATACLTCMPGSLGNVWSLSHLGTALQTGVLAGILAVLLSLTPARRLYGNRLGNALIVGSLAAIADAYSHPNHYGILLGEPLLTGAIAFLLALVSAYLAEDRARRIRAAWARLARRRQ